MKRNKETAMKKLILTIAIALAFAPAAQAADVKLPKDMPAYGKDKPIPAPKIAKKTLANGLQVWVVERNGVPRVDYVLAVRGAGYAADDKDHPGFSNLMAGLLNEGTAKRDSRAIAEAAQGMGGSVGASTTVDGMLVSANAVTSRAGDMMALLAEVARHPAFPANEVALAKANALQSLKVQEATPGFRAERAISKAVYGDHPYGRVQPTAEAIGSATEAMFKAEHARRFRPDQALLVITGRIKQADAMALAQQAFGDWKAQGAPLPATPPAPVTAAPSASCSSATAACNRPSAWAAPASPPPRPTSCPCAWPAPSSAAAFPAGST